MGSALASQAQLSPLWRSYDTATGSPLSGSATAIASRAQQLSPFRCSGLAAIRLSGSAIASLAQLQLSPLQLSSYHLLGSASPLGLISYRSRAHQPCPLRLSNDRLSSSAAIWQLLPLRLSNDRLLGSAAIASQAHQLSPLGLSSYRLSGSAAIAPRAQQLSPLGLSSNRRSSSAAIASRAQQLSSQQLSPLGLSSYRLSGSAAIASRAQQLSPLGLSSYCLSSYRLSGSAAIAPPVHQLSPLRLISFRLSGPAAIALRAQQLSPLGLSGCRPSSSSAIAPRARYHGRHQGSAFSLYPRSATYWGCPAASLVPGRAALVIIPKGVPKGALRALASGSRSRRGSKIRDSKIFYPHTTLRHWTQTRALKQGSAIVSQLLTLGLMMPLGLII